MDGRLREALLKQDGIEPDAMPASEKEKLRRLFARDRTEIRWLKWGTALAWVLTLAVFIGLLFFDVSFR